jgi:hypothetical protein
MKGGVVGPVGVGDAVADVLVLVELGAIDAELAVIEEFEADADAELWVEEASTIDEVFEARAVEEAETEEAVKVTFADTDELEAEAEADTEAEVDVAFIDAESDVETEATAEEVEEAEAEDEEALADVDEATGASWYTLSLLPAPQYSLLLPPHSMLQSAAGAGTDPTPKVLPQKHSLPYSTPA